MTRCFKDLFCSFFFVYFGGQDHIVVQITQLFVSITCPVWHLLHCGDSESLHTLLRSTFSSSGESSAASVCSYPLASWPRGSQWYRWGVLSSWRKTQNGLWREADVWNRQEGHISGILWSMIHKMSVTLYLYHHGYLPCIANIHHGVFALFPRNVFRSLGLLRFLRLLVARAVWPDLRLFFCARAAQEGGRGGVQAGTLTHCRCQRDKHPAWDYMTYTCKRERATVTRRRYNDGDSLWVDNNLTVQLLTNRKSCAVKTVIQLLYVQGEKNDSNSAFLWDFAAET